MAVARGGAVGSCVYQRGRGGEGQLGCWVGIQSQEYGRLFFGKKQNPLGRKLLVMSTSQCEFVVSLELLGWLCLVIWCGELKESEAQ